MAYRLNTGEAVACGLRRIVLEELRSAADRLHKSNSRTRDEAIHEARKSIKKTRAVLRLVSPGLEGVYQSENRRLRDIGQGLSPYRDTVAMIEIFDQFREKHAGRVGAPALESIRRGLLQEKRAQALGSGIVTAVRQAGAALTAAARRAEKWPLSGDGFELLVPGLEKGYRRGRKTMHAARTHMAAQYSHDWRKRLKDHWYHIRLLEDLWNTAMADYEKSLKHLETLLGDHHNLEVLCRKLDANVRCGGPAEDTRRCLTGMRKYQRGLRRDALSLGKLVFADSPREFMERLEQLWSAWQARSRRAATRKAAGQVRPARQLASA